MIFFILPIIEFYPTIMYYLFMIIFARKAIIECLVYLVQRGTANPISVIESEQFDILTNNIVKKIKTINQKICLKRSNTSHLFGLKFLNPPNTLDLTKFNQIIEFNPEENYIRVGGNTNLAELIIFLQDFDYGLKVIPDWDHLTIGGLYAGIGGGSRTFKHGGFFNIVKQVEIITGKGEKLICDETNNSEMFKMLPSSLGSLGYALSLQLEIEPIKKYVYSRTYEYDNCEEFFKCIEEFMQDSTIDFLDGTVFNPTKFVIIIGKMTNDCGNYTLYGKTLGIPYDVMVENGYEGIYEYYDYIFKWDVDGYYTFREKHLSFLQNKYLRKIMDKRLFSSTRLRNLGKLFGVKVLDSNNQIKEYVGDFMVPLSKCVEYYKWYELNGDNCYPLYICPIKFSVNSPFIKTDQISVDFGVGYGVTPKSDIHRVNYLRKCMIQAYEVGGDMLKYNSIYKNDDEFWSFYPNLKIEYLKLKNKHDPDDKFYSVSEKLTR